MLGGCLWVFVAFARAEELLDFSRFPDLDPPEATLSGLSGLYGDEKLRAYMRNVFKGDRVTVLIYGEKASRAHHHRSGLRGWVETRWLDGIDPQKVLEWRERVAEAAAVQQAIQERRVIAGMTPDQVREALGRPNAQSFREDESGRLDVWNYVTFRYVRQLQRVCDPLTGGFQYIWVRVKQETGSLRVEFQNGVVVAVEQTLHPEGSSIRQPQLVGP